jgi:hypothetical protein
MNPYQDLLYCRQFIFCQKEIQDFDHWQKYTVNNYFLYVHPKLKVTKVSRKSKELFLLGSLFDSTNKMATDEDITEKLIDVNEFKDLLAKSENYTGRYVLIYKDDRGVKLFHDPSASRRVHYLMDEEKFCCATQPHLIAKYLDIPKTSNMEVLNFYKSDQFYSHNQVGVMENTIYDPIKLLTANFYIDITNRKVIRFWPYRKLNSISLNEGIELVTKELKGFMANIHQRNKIVMGVTAGNDSRLLLASAREFKDDIFIYVFHLPRMKNERHQDLEAFQKIVRLGNMKGKIVSHNPKVDPDFKAIYDKNNEFASQENLSLIYNFHYKECADKLNVSTTMSDVTRNFFSSAIKVTPEILTNLWYYKGNKYVLDIYKRWLMEVEEYANALNYNILDIFNWEERISSWQSYYLSDCDIARDEVAVLNSRKVLEIMLSVPAKYRDMHTNIFHRSMVKKMWPELGTVSYNPNFKKKVSYSLKKMGIYWPIRKAIRGW